MEKININNLAYTLKRSNRKSLGMTIEKDGDIIVRAPFELDIGEIENFISGRQIWVQQKIAQKESVNRKKPTREFVNGQGFPYLGRSYRLRLIPVNEKSQANTLRNGMALKLKQGYFELPDRQKMVARKHFVAWYKQKTLEKLKERIPRYANRIGVHVGKYRTSDLGNRWASHSKNATISFNWRSVMTPIWVFDYILVHEMIHMIERQHSKEFWRIVSRVMPEYKEHVRWLSENGADCDL
jgi:predicted metal-dependent hydrolase